MTYFHVINVFLQTQKRNKLPAAASSNNTLTHHMLSQIKTFAIQHRKPINKKKQTRIN